MTVQPEPAIEAAHIGYTAGRVTVDDLAERLALIERTICY